MRRSLPIMILASAVYGFAGGAVHSWLYAVRNLVKFPLLILGITAVCAVSYFLFARLITSRLSFLAVQRLVVRLFCDLSVLLAALSPVVLFLALTFCKPAGRSLGEYPFFLGMNVLFIAVGGTLALIRLSRNLLKNRHVSRCRSLLIIVIWIALSFFVGSQWAWYLRPFYGVASVVPQETFCLGARPDFRGDTNFYSAVYHLISPSVVKWAKKRGIPAAVLEGISLLLISFNMKLPLLIVSVLQLCFLLL